MSSVEAIFVPFPPKTGTNLLHHRPPPIVERVLSTCRSRDSASCYSRSNISPAEEETDLGLTKETDFSGSQEPTKRSFLSLWMREARQRKYTHQVMNENNMDHSIESWEEDVGLSQKSMSKNGE